MKLKIRYDYWKKKEGWQEKASLNIWIIAALFLYIIIELSTIHQLTKMAIAVGAIGLIVVVPQRLAYSKWRKEMLHEKYGLKDKEQQEVEDDKPTS